MKTKNKSFASWLVIGVLGLLAIGSVAWAGSTFSWSSVEDKVANLLAGKVSVPVEEVVVKDEVLGAVSNGTQLGPMVCSNDECVYSAHGFITGSSTVFSMPNPFLTVTSSVTDKIVKWDRADAFGWTGASSTIEFVAVDIIESATTTYEIACATAPTAHATSSISVEVFKVAGLVTSTVGRIESGVSVANGRGLTGGTFTKGFLTPDLPYLICKADSSEASETSFTDTGVQFEIIVSTRIRKLRF